MPFSGQIGHFGQKLHIFYFFTHFRKYLTQLLSVMGETGFCHIVTRHGLQALADLWPRCDREVTTLADLWPRCDQSVTTLTDLWLRYTNLGSPWQICGWELNNMWPLGQISQAVWIIQTVYRAITPKKIFFVVLFTSLLFFVGVTIYQNDGKSMIFAELLTEITNIRIFITLIMDQNHLQVIKIT